MSGRDGRHGEGMTITHKQKEDIYMTTEKKMSATDLLNWLTQACMAQGATMICNGFPRQRHDRKDIDDEAGINIEIKGVLYYVNISRPLAHEEGLIRRRAGEADE